MYVIQINTVMLVLAIRAILRGKKKGGAEYEVNNMKLARYRYARFLEYNAVTLLFLCLRNLLIVETLSSS